MTDFQTARKAMVDSQLRPNGITDHKLLEVMGQVPRELFVPVNNRGIAYSDSDVALQAQGGSRYLMAPMTFARMVQAAAFSEEQSVLVVGAGSGYGCAVIAHLADSVIGIESDPVILWEQPALTSARLVRGDLVAGHSSEGPYDVIIIEGSVQTVPESLLAQLKNGGKLITVIAHAEQGRLTVFTRADGHMSAQSLYDASAKPLPGFECARVAFVFAGEI